MDYKNEFFVSLKIFDFDCSHERITEILELTPTEIHKKGDFVVPKSTRRFQENIWVLKLQQNNIYEVETLLNKLINILQNKKDKFLNLPQNLYIEISIVGYMECGIPSLHFDYEQIAFIHDIKAEIDIDLYKRAKKKGTQDYYNQINEVNDASRDFGKDMTMDVMAGGQTKLAQDIASEISDAISSEEETNESCNQ